MKIRVKYIFAVIVLLAAGYFVYLRVTTDKKPAPKESLQVLFSDVSQDIQDGQYNVAEKKLNEYIDSSASVSDRQSAQVNLATVLLYKKEDAQALDLLLRLEKEKASFGYTTYVMIASIYEKRQEKAKAADYYQKAVEAANASSEITDDMYVKYYEQKIKNLRGN